MLVQIETDSHFKAKSQQFFYIQCQFINSSVIISAFDKHRKQDIRLYSLEVGELYMSDTEEQIRYVFDDN